VRRIWIVPSLVLALLLVVSNLTRQSSSAPLPTPPGKLVDIGGRKLHFYCSGLGPTTVIFENGATSFSIDWELVRPKVARTTRVCVYDRAGYGWSDPTPKIDWADHVVHDLFVGLKNAGEHPPYVLVGQSIGGLFSLLYWHEHSDQVAGVVLVDHRAIAVPMGGKPAPLWTLTQEQLQTALPPPSSLRKPPIPTNVHPPFDKLPPDAQAIHLRLEQRFFENLDFSSGPGMMESWRKAFITVRQPQNNTADVPLIILTAEDTNTEERQQQADLLRLSRNSKQIIAARSGHFVQFDRPDLVIDTIQQVLSEISTRKY